MQYNTEKLLDIQGAFLFDNSFDYPEFVGMSSYVLVKDPRMV